MGMSCAIDHGAAARHPSEISALVRRSTHVVNADHDDAVGEIARGIACKSGALDRSAIPLQATFRAPATAHPRRLAG